jgi:hypothetical protein
VAVGGLNEVLVIESAWVEPETESESTFEADCWGLPLSVAVTVMLNVPDTVGVPKSAPVVEFIDMPLGWPNTDQL